jgi:hypothetical protein
MAPLLSLEIAMTPEEFDVLILPIKELMVKKSQDYGKEDLHSYFPFGHKSYVQMLFTKVKRLVSLSRSPTEKPKFESRYDTVVDLINYSVFYLDYLTRDQIIPGDQNEDI